MLIQITETEIDVATATNAISNKAAGAINIFLGVVRNNNKGRDVSYLVYDAYPEMAEKEMQKIAKEAISKFDLEDCSIIHRVGRLEISETSLLIAVSSGHREAAFLGGKWLVDEIKRRIPVWKKEVWTDGEEGIEGPEALGLQTPPESLKNA